MGKMSGSSWELSKVFAFCHPGVTSYTGSTISSHPNLQIDITCHSGRMGLSGREIDKTGFGLCHSGFWTFLDVFVSRLLQICAGFGLVSDDQIFWRAHQIC